MSQRAWRLGVVVALFASATAACSFELGEVETGAPQVDGGGTPDGTVPDDGATLDSTTGSDGAVGADSGADTSTTDAAPGDGRDTAPPIDTGVDAGPTRVTAGLVALYTFKEGAGATVHDVSGFGAPLDMTIEEPANTTWIASGLHIGTATNILSGVQALKVINAITVSNALTVEAWATSSTMAITATSARLVSCGTAAISGTNFDIAQLSVNWGGSLRGMGAGTTTFDSASAVTLTRTHFVFTRDAAGAWVTYVNGNPTANGSIAGSFATTWDQNGTMNLANSANGTRPFVGTMHLAAVYQRPLALKEVQQNYNVGP